MESKKDRLIEGKHTILNRKNPDFEKSIYHFNDLDKFGMKVNNYSNALESLEELLERNEQRKQDGFWSKIKMGKIIKKGRGYSQFVVIPIAEEEKFYHDSNFRYDLENITTNLSDDEEDAEEFRDLAGSGKGKIGEVIGEEPFYGDGYGEETCPGDEEGDHEKGFDPYEVGRLLTEKFKLPNIQEKGKKKSPTKYKYEMTGKNDGSGQIMDKNATLKKIIKTNIGLRIIKEGKEIDPSKLIVAPRDFVYRIPQKEKDYEEQALVFFLRDYSGSMHGEATEIVVSQHLLIYSWLIYQYKKNVSSRFIVHDVKAKEIPNFYEYFNLNAAGGTDISSSFKLVNQIVEEENLKRDYNIYVFYGGDGGDIAEKTIPEIGKMAKYSNRIGITLARDYPSYFEEEFKKSGILENHGNLIKMNLLKLDSDEEKIIEGIKELVSENETYKPA